MKLNWSLLMRNRPSGRTAIACVKVGARFNPRCKHYPISLKITYLKREYQSEPCRRCKKNFSKKPKQTKIRNFLYCSEMERAQKTRCRSFWSVADAREADAR